MKKSASKKSKVVQPIIVVFNGSVKAFELRHNTIKEIRDKQLLAEASICFKKIQNVLRDDLITNAEHIFYSDF